MEGRLLELAGQTRTVALGGSAAHQIFEPGVATPRTATVTVSELCPEPGKTFSVSDVRFDVSGLR